MDTKLMKAHPGHEVTFQELNNLVGRNAGKLSKIEILAVAANLVGKLMAMQDQRAFTPDQVMEIVAKNIEHGNRQAIENLKQAEGHKA